MSKNGCLTIALGLSVLANVGLLARAAGDTRKPRLFKLCIYTAAEGKLDALQARFRDHGVKLFEKHGITSIGYFVPAEGPTSRNTLIFLHAYPDRQSHDKAIQNAMADPDWDRSTQPPLAVKAETLLLNPTDFSALK